MGDAHEMCGCSKPDITIFETCLRCGNAVSFEELRQRAVDTYDKDDQPIEDPSLPRRHSPMKDPKRCLRLLHLNDSTSHVLSGRFECDWIHRVRPYEAVSYTWGGEDGDYTKTEFILIDGKLFPITKNCAAVLHKIRKPGETLAIWIDSICINQNDVNERSVQVSQMGKIFSGAQKVHIYIGSNVDDRTVSNAFYVLGSVWNLSDFNTMLSVRKDREQAVKTLFAQTYFSRMWVIQEVLLAKTAELHWGSASIPWQVFNKDHLKVLRNGIDSYIPEWMRIRATKKNFRNSETLGELLFSAMGSTASNHRDKVYGIYGLLLDAEEEGLTVDYTLSVSQVFTNMAVHLIKKQNALRAVLQHANRHAPLVDGEQLPSWVPDFRSRSVSKEVSISRDGFEDLDVDSSITLEESVSSYGTNELFLRGHRLTMPGLLRESPTEYSKARTKIKVQVRAKFPVAFDPLDHTIFWMPDGTILQLERHPNREDAYIFLGECAIKGLGKFPGLVLHYRHPDVMDGLELSDLKPLWELCMNLGCISHSERERIQFGLKDLKLPDTSMGWEKAEHACDLLAQYFHQWNAYDFERLLDRNRTPLEPDARQMLQFLQFYQSDETWEVLGKSKVWRRTWHSQQKINELCMSWLQCYETAGYLIKKSSKITHKDSTLRPMLRSQFLNLLELWEKTTRELSKPLRGTEIIPWPSQKPGRNKDKKARYTPHRGGIGLCTIAENFYDVRLRFDQPVRAQRSPDKIVEYVLKPWSKGWVGTVRSIPYLLAINEQLRSIHVIYRSRIKPSGQETGKPKYLEVWPAETITLL